MTDENTKKDPGDERMRTEIRFNKDEFVQVRDLAKDHGVTLAQLLKKTLFEQMPKRPVFDRETGSQILTALSRIGNNINQIARQMNSGIREGFQADIVQLAGEVRALRSYIGG